MKSHAATIWKGAIHFGATEIPVKLHAAVREERIQFHLLHREDRVRLHQQMICAYENTPVPVEVQVQGPAEALKFQVLAE